MGIRSSGFAGSSSNKKRVDARASARFLLVAGRGEDIGSLLLPLRSISPLLLPLLALLLLLSFSCCPAQLVTRETDGHPKGGAHGRAPGATLGRMPNVVPACAGTALVAFDSKQPMRFLWLLSLSLGGFN
ncbi:hypothetical protein ACFQ4Q_22080, partial [Lysobacter gummosus]|uniref:hypothetical protein n=1 Tax=Lysobacter gummosus TaxID=262324 RepID=UPI003633E9A9